MKILELFAGTRSIGKCFQERGHEVFSIDWDKKFKNINWYADISKITAEEIVSKFGCPDVIWASPDCTTYSIAAIGKHRTKNVVTGNLDPKSEYARFSDNLNIHLHELIRDLKPRYWFIENPRGGMRKMCFMNDLADMKMYTVTYCQYGDTRMKPTDIFTNHPNPRFKPPCKPRSSCHESAPRRTTIKMMEDKRIEIPKIGGTQYGLKDSVERSRIPRELCMHIVDICENPTGINPVDENQLSFLVHCIDINISIKYSMEG